MRLIQPTETAVIPLSSLLGGECPASARPMLSQERSVLDRSWKFIWEVLMNRGRTGFTLMELVVVMVILMALAAIVLPMFPNMIERAHRASQGSNDSEIAKAILTYQSIYGNFPDGYDLMTDGATMINYMPSVNGASPMPLGETPTASTNYLGFTNPVGGYVNAAPLTANAQTALTNAGISNVYPMANGVALTNGVPTTTGYTGTVGFTPTFNPYPTDLPAPININTATTTAVMYVNGSGILVANLANPAIVNKASQTQFVMFGLGKRCSAIGTVLANATYNFPNDAVHENPDLVYERFGVIYQVEGPTGAGLPSAQFIGVVAIESNVLLGVDKVDESYTENIPQASAPVAGPGI
jgi:type II secretory pathway pseudopilin PulG